MADVLISKSNAKRYLGGSIPPSTSNNIDGEPVPPSTVIGEGEWVPYLGAKDNVDLGEYFLKASYLQLKTDIATIPTAQGAMYWDQDEETVAIILNGSTTKVGEDIFFQVKNQSGSTIPKGTAVRFDGVVGASGRINIVPFLADGSNPSIYFLGVTYESIANGADGKALFNGKIRGVNTNAFAVGDILYASPTVAGGFTTTKPVAPNNIISVAAVLSSGPNGILLIRPQIGSNINNDEGVNITTPTTGDLLQLQVSGLWENKSVASLSLVPQSRTLTINETVFDLSANRNWTIPVHDAVTLGTANGLSLSGQVLSLGLASGSSNGALSSTDWTTFNNKIGGTIASGQVAFGTGAGVVGGDSSFNWENVSKTLRIGTTGQIAGSLVTLRRSNNVAICLDINSTTINDFSAITWNGFTSSLGGLGSQTAAIVGAIDGIGAAGRLEFWTRIFNVNTVRWSILSNGILQSNGAQTIQTSSGNLTLATGGGNGNINLTLNGTGKAQVNGSPIITGTIASGQVAFGTGAGVVGGDNGLFWNNVNKRLGIGASIPLYNLDVTFNNTSIDQFNDGVLIRNTSAGSFGSTSALLFQAGSSTGINAFIGTRYSNFTAGTGNGGELYFGTKKFDDVSPTWKWRVTQTGILESATAQTIQTLTGNLTLATAGGNGNILLSPNGSGRVGIGTLSPISSAILDLSSTTRGFLPPRMTTTQRNAIASPVAGLMIYNTTTNLINVYNGTIWI